MPMIEMDEEAGRTLVAAKNLVDRMGANPKTRHKFLSLVKDLNPGAVIPEIDAAGPVIEKVDAVDGRVAKLEKDLADERAQRAQSQSAGEVDRMISDGREYLRSQGFLDEGIAKVEQLMKDEGIVNYRAGAALYHSTAKPDDPVSPTSYGNRWNLANPGTKDDDHKEWLRDPEGRAQREVAAFLQETRGSRAARHY